MNEVNLFKAKITTNRGTFEFEGSQEFVEKQVKEIADIEKKAPTPATDHPIKPTEKSSRTVHNNGGSRKVSSEQPKMLASLVSKDQITDLKEFYNSKNPETQIGTFAVLTYWLKTKAESSEVGIDEMWTLYKVLQTRAPGVLIQAFRDGKSKKGYFESADTVGKYYLTTIGETFVEHDLPRTPKKK